jgi:branched-chain amino acid transport system permease protein
MGVGAYTVAWLSINTGLPFPITLLAAGLLVGLPSLRVKGLYLAIATLAASVFLHFIFAEWEPVTRGTEGLSLDPAHLFGVSFRSDFAMYFIIVPLAVLAVLALLAAKNLFRTRVGRAFIAIRDRDISAEILGIPLLKYKLMSFALSSFYAGVAGGLFAYFYRVVTSESFPLSMSIFYLAAVIVGGMGNLLGGHSWRGIHDPGAGSTETADGGDDAHLAQCAGVHVTHAGNYFRCPHRGFPDFRAPRAG